MKKNTTFKIIRFYLIIFLSFPFLGNAAAPTRTFGLGLGIGSPTAVTGKYWLEGNHAIDFGLTLNDSNWTTIYGDYHWASAQLFGSSTQFAKELTAYMGVGGGLTFWSHYAYCNKFGCGRGESGTALLLRVPFGAEWTPARTRIGAFFELVPHIYISPSVSSSLDLQIGCRYYF